MQVRKLNEKRAKKKSKRIWLQSIKKLKSVILQPVNVILLLLLQILADIENYQYSRMRILHMNCPVLINIL